jgi:hypothetical protein
MVFLPPGGVAHVFLGSKYINIFLRLKNFSRLAREQKSSLIRFFKLSPSAIPAGPI